MSMDTNLAATGWYACQRWPIFCQPGACVAGACRMARRSKGPPMIAVLFESKPHPGQKDAYLAAAARLGPLAETTDGFMGVERFESITNPGKIMAISYWRDEES